MIAALAISVLIALALPSPTSSNGCIIVTFAGPTGAQSVHQCGAQARESCRMALVSSRFNLGQALVDACRQAGLPVRP